MEKRVCQFEFKVYMSIKRKTYIGVTLRDSRDRTSVPRNIVRYPEAERRVRARSQCSESPLVVVTRRAADYGGLSVCAQLTR